MQPEARVGRGPSGRKEGRGGDCKGGWRAKAGSTCRRQLPAACDVEPGLHLDAGETSSRLSKLGRWLGSVWTLRNPRCHISARSLTPGEGRGEPIGANRIWRRSSATSAGTTSRNLSARPPPPKSIDSLEGPRPRPRANCRACLDFQLPGVLALNSGAHLCVWVERTSEVTDRSRFSGGFGDRQKMRDMSRDAHG